MMTAAISTRPSTTSGARPRAAVQYALHGDLRYLSHHDEMRMLARVLVRAGWPLRYSAGFNPIPRLSLPLPRSVGLASDCQLALVELTALENVQALSDRLAGTLPRGCSLHRVLAPAAAGAPHPRAVEYVIDLDTAATRAVAAGLGQLLARERLVVTRSGRPGQAPQSVDIRPHIERLELDGTCLHVRLRYENQRTARLCEILAELNVSADAQPPRCRRTEIIWNMQLAAAGAAQAIPKGTKLGTTEEDYAKEKI